MSVWLHLLFLFSLSALLLAPAQADPSCDADVVRAFADVTSLKEKDFSYKRIMNLSCMSQTLSSGMKVTFPVKGIPITGSGNLDATNDACASQNETYFRDYSRDFFLQQTSEPVKLALISSCFSGRVQLIAREDSGSITLTALAPPNGNQFATVKSFEISPKNGVKVSDKTFVPTDVLSAGGVTHSFERQSQKTVTFSMNTANGLSNSVSVPGLTFIPVTWKIRWVGEGRGVLFQCIGTVGSSKAAQRIGGARDSRQLGFNGVGNGNYLASYCGMIYGNRIAKSPQHELPWQVPDTWETSALAGANDYTAWNCKRNGKVMGDVSCPAASSSGRSCTNIDSRKTICANSYGAMPITADELFDFALKAAPKI